LVAGLPRDRELRASVEILDDLVRARPLLLRDHQIDVAAAESVERVIGAASRVEAHASELVAPRERCCLVLKHADCLPVLEPGVTDQHARFTRAVVLSKPPNAHPR